MNPKQRLNIIKFIFKDAGANRKIYLDVRQNDYSASLNFLHFPNIILLSSISSFWVEECCAIEECMLLTSLDET